MSKKSSIEWTESTWNPITGCSKISDGCKNCYAEKMAKRLKAMGLSKYRNGFEVTLHPNKLNEPIKWKKPQIIFVCSMSDIFHPDVPLEYILMMFEIMNEAKQHIFQVLTKRPERLVELKEHINWTNNIWMGVTIESQKYIHRLDKLTESNAKIKYLSLEPLLDKITLPDEKLKYIDWVIVGGESGSGARVMKKEWVIEIRNVCNSNNVPFFFKQWGGVNKKKNGRILDDVTWDEMPKISALSS